MHVNNSSTPDVTVCQVLYKRQSASSIKTRDAEGSKKMNVLNNSMLALQRISALSVCGQKVTAVFPVIITVVSVSCLTILIIKTSPLNQANP